MTKGQIRAILEEGNKYSGHGMFQAVCHYESGGMVKPLHGLHREGDTFKLCCRTPIRYKHHDKRCPTQDRTTRHKKAFCFGQRQHFTWADYELALLDPTVPSGQKGSTESVRIHRENAPHENETIQRLSEAYRDAGLGTKRKF